MPTDPVVSFVAAHPIPDWYFVGLFFLLGMIFGGKIERWRQEWRRDAD